MGKKKIIVADTCVWYHLSGNNERMLNRITSLGELYATPISFLELVSKMSSEFNRGMNAVKAVVRYAKDCLPMHELELSRYFGVDIKDDINWMDRFRLARVIKNLDELNELIANRKIFNPNNHRYETVIFNINLITKWRKRIYSDFNELVINAITSVIEPKYKSQVKTGNILKINDKEKLSMLNNAAMYQILADALSIRANNFIFDYTGKRIDFDERTLNKAKLKLDCYIKIYIEYIRDIIKRGAKPDRNDLGDFESFMYLEDDDFMLATTDKKWIEYCRHIYPKRILDLKKYVKNKK